MLYRDYIGRLTEAIAKSRAALAGLKEKGKFEEGIEVVKHHSKSSLKLDLDELAAISFDRIIAVLKDERNFSDEELSAAAYYFAHLGDFQNSLGGINSQALENDQKALVIYRWLQECDRKNFVLDRENRIKALEDRIRKGSTNPLDNV